MSEIVLDDILTPEEAAKFLKIEVRRLMRRIKRGEIPAKQIARGEWRLKASEISKWFEDWQLNSFDPNKKAARNPILFLGFGGGSKSCFIASKTILN